MEDKITTKSISDIKDFILKHSMRHLSHEICGFIGYDKSEKKYVVTLEKNASPDPKSFFLISPVSYLQFKNEYSILGIFHSHIIADEQASEFDIKMSEANCLPFIIYSINSKKFNIYEPKNQDYDVNIFHKVKVKLK